MFYVCFGLNKVSALQMTLLRLGYCNKMTGLWHFHTLRGKKGKTGRFNTHMVTFQTTMLNYNSLIYYGIDF